MNNKGEVLEMGSVYVDNICFKELHISLSPSGWEIFQKQPFYKDLVDFINSYQRGEVVKKCPICNALVLESDNFCMYCGTKLKETCNCWVLKKDNYNCGKSSCPGISLLIPK